METLTQFGVGTLAMSAIAWLLREAIAKMIQTEGAIAVEKIKSSSRMEETEHSIAFSETYAKRREVIEHCYGLLSLVYRQAARATNIQDAFDAPERSELIQKVLKSIWEFDEYLHMNRLHLPRGVADRANEFASKIFLAGQGYGLMLPHADKDKEIAFKAFTDARKVIGVEAKGILDELEGTFRDILEGKDQS